jgi:hypothetical protein
MDTSLPMHRLRPTDARAGLLLLATLLCPLPHVNATTRHIQTERCRTSGAGFRSGWRSGPAAITCRARLSAGVSSDGGKGRAQSGSDLLVLLVVDLNGSLRIPARQPNRSGDPGWAARAQGRLLGRSTPVGGTRLPATTPADSQGWKAGGSLTPSGVSNGQELRLDW